MPNDAKTESDRDLVQVLRDEANEWHNGSETGSLLREAAQKLSDALDLIDNMECGMTRLRQRVWELEKGSRT